MKRCLGAWLAVLLLAACGSPPTPTPTPPRVAPTTIPAAVAETSVPDPTPTVAATASAATATRPAEVTEPTAPPAQAQRLPTTKGEFFTGSGLCATCHTNQVDRSGTDVSTDRMWRSTMMANGARDPYWQGSVRVEVLTHPQHQALIEDKCATCHMPLARFTAAAHGGQGAMLDEGFVYPGHDLHALAMDGVSCTLCHQIQDANLGDANSFSGHFAVDAELQMGQRPAYGPYQTPRGLSNVMQSSSGLVPVLGEHVGSAGLCATCHTLYTPYLDDAGAIAGEFPEQTPYLEWLQSVYYEAGMPCQGCHMPRADGAVRLSVTGGPPRSPFFQHTFVGGNAYMLRILQRFGGEVAATATGEMFGVKEQSTLQQLQGRTANLALQDLSLSDSSLAASVVINNLAGHKFPSGFPSRRAWLHLTVSNADGQVLFESGAVGPDGAIAGEDGDADPGRYEPHYATIDSPEQVQVYESVMKDVNGQVTLLLLRGAGYLKDNRLLPLGFDKAGVDPDIAVYGAAAGDEDFAAGGDRVRYVVDVGAAPGPFTVHVELLYQSISFRWAQKLRGYEADEPGRFVRYYEAVPNLPAVIAIAEAQVSP